MLFQPCGMKFTAATIPFYQRESGIVFRQQFIEVDVERISLNVNIANVIAGWSVSGEGKGTRCLRNSPKEDDYGSTTAPVSG